MRDAVNVTLLEHIGDAMRAALRTGRTVHHVYGFDVAIAAEGSAPGLAVAVPRSPEPDSYARALAAVQAAFDAADAAPRIEYVEQLCPRLWPAARALGWRSEPPIPVMALASSTADAGWLHGTEAPAGAVVRFPGADDDCLEAFVVGQQRAYGGADATQGPPDADARAWLRVLRHGLAGGAMQVVAVMEGSQVVAGASLVRTGNVGELAGVWTRPEAQGRGLARTACAAAIAHAFGAGVRLAWLSSAPGATRLYERLGFRAVGHQRALTPEPRPPRRFVTEWVPHRP